MANCYNWTMPTAEVGDYKIDYHPVGGSLSTVLLSEIPLIEDGSDTLFVVCLEVAPVFRDVITDNPVVFPYTVTEGGTCTSHSDCVITPPPTTFNITLLVSPVGSGTVSNVSISLGSPPPYEEGNVVVVSTIPLPGWTFVNWTDQLDDSIQSTDFTFVYTMPARNVTLVANYVVNEDETPPTPPEGEDPEVPLPVVNGVFLPDLYENCSKFLLVKDLPYNLPVGSVLNTALFDDLELDWVEISEPVGWDTVKFKMERTDDYGFTQIASLDSLEFKCVSGKPFLDNVFVQNGGDTNVKFIFAVNSFGSSDYLVALINDINFTSYEYEIDSTKVNLEGSEFNQLLETRKDTPYIYPRALPVFLYSKALPETSQFTRKTTRLFEDLNSKPTNLGSIVAGYGLFNSDASPNEIAGVFTYPDQMTYIDPVVENKYVMKPKLPGKYSIDINVAATAIGLTQYTLESISNPFPDISGPSNGEMPLKLVVKVIDTLTDEIKFEEISDPTNYVGGKSVSYFLGDGSPAVLPWVRVQEFTKSYQFELTSNDELYVYLRINKRSGDPNSVAWSEGNVLLKLAESWTTLDLTPLGPPPTEYRPFDLTLPLLSIYGLTLQKPSIDNRARLFTAMDSVLRQLAEKARQVLLSDFLGEDGAMWPLTVGNGFGLRGDAVVNSATDSRSSFRALFEGAKSLVNLGWNVEVDPDGLEVVRVEEMDYFFQDKEILTFLEESGIQNYKERFDPDLVFNEIEVGYQKFSKERETDKGETLQDTHGKSIFLTPIRKNKNRLSIVSQFIGSAFEIERIRRKQFDPESQNSNERYDNDVYMVNLRLENQEVSAVSGFQDFFSVPNTADFLLEPSGFRFLNRTNIPIVEGDIVQLLYNGIPVGTRVVREVLNSPQGVSSTVYDTYILFTQAPPALPLTPTVDLTIVLPSTRFIPESVEPFEEITNLESPQTHYNLRYTPKRMLKNWGKYINAGLSFKDGAELIKFQEGEGNMDLTTELSVDDPFPLGDIQRDVTKEGADITLSSVWGRNSRFLAYLVEFSIPMGFDVYNYIIRAHKGNSADDNNYGYIQVPDFKGNLIRGYLVDLEYDPNTRKADFIVRFSARLPILEADILRPINTGDSRTLIDENGNYIQYD